jgi:hypothetical protein
MSGLSEPKTPTSAGSSRRRTRQPAPRPPDRVPAASTPCPLACAARSWALISAAWAGFGRLRGRVATMVMAVMPNAPSALARRRCLRLARLNGCKGDRIDDIVHHRTARQVVHRFAQPLQHRTDANHMRRSLYCLVGGVASVEIGKTNTVARPATALSGTFWRPTLSTLAASYCSGPSISRSGRLARAIVSARTTFSTSAPLPEVPVE